MSIQTTDPNRNKIIKSFREMTDKYLNVAVSQSQLAYHNWKETSYLQRADVLSKVALLMRVKKAALSKLIALK